MALNKQVAVSSVSLSLLLLLLLASSSSLIPGSNAQQLRVPHDTNCYANVINSLDHNAQPEPWSCFGQPPPEASPVYAELAANTDPGRSFLTAGDMVYLNYNRSLGRFQPLTIIDNYYVFLLIHDYQGSAYDDWIAEMARTLYDSAQRQYSQSPYNNPTRLAGVQIIAVDWSRAATQHQRDDNFNNFNDVNSYYYGKAAANAVEVARLVGNMLNELITDYTKNPNAPFANLHCIGFGMGAHICGVASKVFKRGRPFWKPFNRITGLDPSRALFEDSDDHIAVNASRRLDRTDAFFVDVIHTTSSYGYKGKIGLVDHYVNGGDYGHSTDINSLQPGCSTEYCSHARAYELFQASINAATTPGPLPGPQRGNYYYSDSCNFQGCRAEHRAKTCRLGYSATINCTFHTQATFCGSTTGYAPFC